MKDLNKTFSERATRFLPVDMKDRLKSAFNRNAPNAAPETSREDEISDYNAIFNAPRPNVAPKTTALNVPLVAGPAGSAADDAASGAIKIKPRPVVPDIEDAEIVEPSEDRANAALNGSATGPSETVSLKPRKADDSTSRLPENEGTLRSNKPQARPETKSENSKHEDAVSQKSKSRFFGDFSSTESVRLKVEKRNEKRAIEPLPIPNGNSPAQPAAHLMADETGPLEEPTLPNFAFESAPAQLQSDTAQDSTEAAVLTSATPYRANIILQEEYQPMDAKAHESENGATADATSGATFAAAIVIERNSKFSGQLKFAGAITIEGQVEGDLTADRITISEGGVVNAAIDGTTIVIAGTVRGDIRAHNELEILPSGVVDGSVTAPAITVRRGGRVEGRCTIGVPRQ